MPRSEHTPGRDTRSRRGSSPSHRGRSVTFKKRFVLAVLATLVFYLSIIALITAAVAFFFVPPELKKTAADILVRCLVVFSAAWLISYMKRRRALCPLCKSTPFLDNLAHKHEHAYRIRPLNYGTTAILTTILFQRWRCMYCGTPFDLLKKSKRS